MASAAGISDVGEIPHLDAAARTAYREFLAAGGHRAFVIAPGGSWSWKSDEPTPRDAVAVATSACGENAEYACVPYAVDDRVVFDAKGWAKLWRPYPSSAMAAQARVGVTRGSRFFDLAFRDRAGRSMKLSDLLGKVVVLHFWGSWCSPCRREMPELQALARILGGRGDIRLVLLQVREDFATASRWAQRQRLDLPFYDSGAGSGENGTLALSNGGTIQDRDLARVFPTTYVLDRHGLVVFAHTGPISDWPSYRPFLLDLSASTAR